MSDWIVLQSCGSVAWRELNATSRVEHLPIIKIKVITSGISIHMSTNLDRRDFLKLTGAIGVSSSLTPGLLQTVLGATDPIRTPASLVDRLDLGGEWRVNQLGKNKVIRATVPGCIHTDLLAAGVIPDPFYRDNAKQLRWVD